MTNITTKDLGYLGENYQSLLVKYMIENPKFFTGLVQIIDQNMFTSEPLKRIVAAMKDHYHKNGGTLNYNDLELVFKTSITDAITLEYVVSKLHELMGLTFDIDIELLTSNAEKFFKQQNLAKAINLCTEILKDGNVDCYGEMESLIKEALETNTQKDMGFRLFDSIEDDLKEDYRCAIPTGASLLDESLFGGLGKGELGLVISPPGVGKSSSMTGFCANAATCKCEDNNNQGFKVLHFFFEDNEVNIRRKYYGYLTNIDACELSDPINRPLALKVLNDNNNELRNLLRNNLIGKRLPTGEYSATDIKYLIQQYISKGFVPDMVVIDYFECIKPERSSDMFNESEWSREGVTMRKLESMANELNIALWVPIQSTKGAINQEFVSMAQAGGSVKKTQIGHIVMQFAQTIQQKDEGRLSIFISKLRAAKIGRTSFVNVKFNNGTCKFDFSDIDTYISPAGGNSNEKKALTASYVKSATDIVNKVY